MLRKCNYADTIQYTLLANWFINRVEELDPKSTKALMSYPMSLALWAVDWYSVMTSVMELSYSAEVFMDRMDYYNVGKISGKLTKLFIQIHMKDLFRGVVK
jgi:hypothetical protein